MCFKDPLQSHNTGLKTWLIIYLLLLKYDLEMVNYGTNYQPTYHQVFNSFHMISVFLLSYVVKNMTIITDSSWIKVILLNKGMSLFSFKRILLKTFAKTSILNKDLCQDFYAFEILIILYYLTLHQIRQGLVQAYSGTQS